MMGRRHRHQPKPNLDFLRRHQCAQENSDICDELARSTKCRQLVIRLMPAPLIGMTYYGFLIITQIDWQIKDLIRSIVFLNRMYGLTNGAIGKRKL